MHHNGSGGKWVVIILVGIGALGNRFGSPERFVPVVLHPAARSPGSLYGVFIPLCKGTLLNCGTTLRANHTRIDLIEKARTHLTLLFSKLETEFAETEKKLFFCPCNRHIEEASLFFNIGIFAIPCTLWEDVLFH